MISLTQARATLTQLSCTQESLSLPIADALGMVASVDVVSKLAIPPADNSAMDGFAINSASLSEDVTTLTISQRIPAGAQPKPLVDNTAARIFTGGTMPDGADAVVIQENCNFDESHVTILQPVVAAANVRPRGQDIRCGATVVKKGQKLNAIDISLLASIGHAEVDVYRPLNVALFSTGDELVEPGHTLKPGQIYNSNRPLLAALCQQLGFDVIDCGIVEDTLDATKRALLHAADNADVIISSGGVSVGEEDHVKPAIEALGELSMWKVQMKPGKPVAYGRIGHVPFLGLPGNPVSSFTVFQLLGVPLLQSLQGQSASEPTAFAVKSKFAMRTTSREEYIRVKLVRGEHGELYADRFPNLSSGVMSSLSWADGLVRQDIGSAIEVGQRVNFLPLHEAML